MKQPGQKLDHSRLAKENERIKSDICEGPFLGLCNGGAKQSYLATVTRSVQSSTMGLFLIRRGEAAFTVWPWDGGGKLSDPL